MMRKGIDGDDDDGDDDDDDDDDDDVDADDEDDDDEDDDDGDGDNDNDDVDDAVVFDDDGGILFLMIYIYSSLPVFLPGPAVCLELCVAQSDQN